MAVVLVAPGKTGVYDRYYQCYKNFDAWQKQGRHFVCRIKASSRKTELSVNRIDPLMGNTGIQHQFSGEMATEVRGNGQPDMGKGALEFPVENPRLKNIPVRLELIIE